MNNYFLHLGHVNVAEILLRHNSNVNAKDDNKDTPLHLAAWNGKFFLILRT